MYYRQQEPSFLEGLISGFMSQREKNQEKKQQSQMYSDVADFGTGLGNLDYGGQTKVEDLASRSNPNSNYLGSKTEAKTAQGLLPTGFIQSTPTVDMIGQGLLGQPKAQQPAPSFFNMPQYQAGSDSQGMLQRGNIDLANRPTLKNQDGSISTVRSMGINVDGKEVLIPTVGPRGENWTEQQAIDNYRQTGQSLGSFDSVDSSNKYAESLHNQQDRMYSNKQPTLMDKYSTANNPANVTVSAPKTLQEQTRMIKSQLPLAMKELIAKGYNPKEILPLLQQATNDRISEHTNTYQEQQLNDLYQGFVKEENPNKKAMYAARLKQMGYDVTTPYKEFAPEYKFEKFDNGGSNEGYSFNPKTGRVEKQVSMNKTVSPDAQLNNDTRILTTGMNNNTSIKVAGMRGNGAKNNHQEGPGTKNGKRLDPVEKAKYAELYQEKLEDIWDSETPEIRAQKIQQHAQDLNELGYLMDRDVDNDIRAITG